ncbi:YkoY family integral membrane protein [Cyanobium sp. Copco_Reservoir_LC18]|uniref:TerC family protein n=1 Tax=Cyanobium sp. Copco_Reservoir_LC18 TaxID=1328305 RepID=UPI00135BB0F7|nr:TerC family protein [Cyanobium sp. Copco_Reservoir_LC18]KAF0653275.1 YkoY family integral membrane protein [Cyanobium sp. Copco_Reservoir_LC18]
MEVESVESLTPLLQPLLQEADQWGEVLLLLLLLVGLEAVLSADNAIALAAISRRLHDPARQRMALNLGLVLALVFRLALIALASQVLAFWPLQLVASAYLLWLCGRHLLGKDDGADEDGADQDPAAADAAAPGSHPGQGHPHHGATLGSIVATLALTDLAFSLDSVSAAVAVTDRVPLVMAGGVIGILALRLTAELFLRWLEIFPHLETAGYLAVGLVGLKLLLRLVLPAVEVPEWALLLLVAGLFAWGFSLRTEPSSLPGPGSGDA